MADLSTLLDAVHAQPHADGPRLVLADWLMDRGEPRGELIALQCRRPPAAAPSPRERELLQGAGAWLDGLEAAGTALAFERGFASVVALRPGWARHALAPAWATVHTVVAGGVRDSLAPLVASPAARSLERLHALSQAQLSNLIESERPRAITGIEGDGAGIAEAFRCLAGVRPELVSFGPGVALAPYLLSRILRAGALSRLARLTMRHGGASLHAEATRFAAWALDSAQAALAEVVLHDERAGMKLKRVAGRWRVGGVAQPGPDNGAVPASWTDPEATGYAW